MKKHIAMVVLTALSCHAMAQHQEERQTWEECLYELIDYSSDDITDETAQTELYDIVSHMTDNPLNINTATREDLERLLLLTDRQIEEICIYLSRYGPMRTTDELILIESLDRPRRKLLQHMIRAGDGRKPAPPRAKEMLRHGKHTLTATVKLPMYRRKGDINGYLGYQYKHWLRYDFTYGKRLRFGIVASQDAGEPMFAGKNAAGYDYYSLYLQLRSEGAFVESLTVGRYRPAFGMGLVTGPSFSLGKSAMLSTLGRTAAEAVRVHSSRSESDYFQGAAVTLRLHRQVKATAIASYRPLDATLNKDGTAATIVTSGYHRTQAEMAKKNNTHATSAGVNICYKNTSNGLHAGITAIHTRLDRQLSPNTATLYRRHYAAGNNFTNISADYGYRSHLLSFGGETAIDRHCSIATIHSLGITPTDRFSLTLLHRYYPTDYASLHAHSFSDGGRVQNEHGVYLGMGWHPSPALTLTAYTDFAHFAFPRYLVSGPSYSSDNMISASCSYNSWTFTGRYRLRLRQRDNEDKTMLAWRTEHRLRLSVAHSYGPRWDSKTQADLAMVNFKTRDRGYMVSQYVSLNTSRLQMRLSASYFHTDSYDSRLYAYEHSVAYTFYIPASYGHGLRYALLARASVARWLTLTAKVSVTDYFDRPSIGSSYQTVYHSSMTDLEIQARIKM